MVNICKIKLTNLQQEIMRLLFLKTGVPLNQRRIAKLLEVSPPAVMKALPYLEKENFIKVAKDKESKRWSIELNSNNIQITRLKKVNNILFLYESGFTNYIQEEYAGATIIVFGSYSRGEDTYTSDIDVADIGRKEKIINLNKFEKILERKIHINYYESWDKLNSQLKNNILNGIILIGGVEL